MIESINIFSTKEVLAEKFCGEFFLLAGKYSSQKKFFNIALSGGKTPEIIFKTLANNYKDEIDWSLIRFFWGDERCVPPDNSESNYGMTKSFLLDKINIPEENIFRVRGEADPASEAKRYQKSFLELFNNNISNAKFDLTMLGLGDDGHTASIFSNSLQMLSTDELFAVAEHPVTKQKRITATGRLINNSHKIVFLVTDENKAVVLNKILTKQDGYQKYPAAHIKPNDGILEWYVEVNAASIFNKR